MNETQIWTDVFANALKFGLGGLLLAAIAWYFKNMNDKLVLKLEAEQAAKLLVIQTENKAKMDMLQLQNDACIKDREVLHKQVDLQQEKLDKMKDQIIDIYRNRNTRNLLEEVKRSLPGPDSPPEKITTKVVLP